MSEYLIDDLARAAGTTVRNVRAYQDRGLLPPAARRGRALLYDDRHLDRLRLVASLLERGYSLAAIQDLTRAWDQGQSLGAVLGAVNEVANASPDEVDVAPALQELGVPQAVVQAELAALRTDMARVADRLVQMAFEHVLSRHAGELAKGEVTPAFADVATHLPRLAQAAVRSELARAMRSRTQGLIEEALRRQDGSP